MNGTDNHGRTAAWWNEQITDAIEAPDPLMSNFKITRLHYLLSRALLDAVGPSAGANFHSWAVWGSRKAGVTIRQEDRDQASRDAMVVAGLVGIVVGVSVGWIFTDVMGTPVVASILGWVLIGLVAGGYCGNALARYTRCAASRLILAGNRMVLDDIGRQTARYLDFVQDVTLGGIEPNSAWESFLREFREGATEEGGQSLLRKAFELYETARRSGDQKVQHECNYFANCLAVLHEHIRLQPFISKSLPFLVRKCVTQRLMSYSVGDRQLTVHDDVPPLGQAAFPATLSQIDRKDLREFLDGPAGWDVGRGQLENTRATDWTKLRERMGYIVNLFRTRHLAPEVVASPYATEQLGAITANVLPPRPW